MTLTRSLVASLTFAVTLAGAAANAADGDIEKGEKVFKKCKACHQVGPKAKNRVGPILTNVVGAEAGAVENYKYGKGLKAAKEKGLIWTEEELDKWLKNPKKYLRAYLDDKKAKTKMSFKLKKDGQRADIIAYLKSLKPAE